MNTKTQRIRIPACREHAGLSVIEVEVPWNCIYCGADRGERLKGLSYDGSRRLTVTMWSNPCGHFESYGAIRTWLSVQRELAAAQ